MQKKHLIVLGVVSLVLIVGGTAFFTYDDWKPVSETVGYRSGSASFTFQRGYSLKEYGNSGTLVGVTTEGGFAPLVEIVSYQNDPDVARPANFDAFIKRQAQVLCGTDNGIDSVTCSDPVIEPITTTTGMKGQKISLSLVRRNLETGAVGTTTYTPIYAFDTTESPDPDETLRYRTTLIYPSFTPFLEGIVATDLMDDIFNTLVIEKLTPTTTPTN